MIGVLPWIISNSRMLLLAVGLLSVMGIGVYLVKKGMDIKEAQYRRAIVQLQNEAREKINDINERHTSELQRILSKPDNGIVCPYATDGIKRLYESGN